MRARLFIAAVGTMVVGTIGAEPDPEWPMPCDSPDTCMVVVESADSTWRDAYQAKIYLDDHGNDMVIRRMAALLRSHVSKLRDRAMWFFATRDDTWPTQVEDLQAVVRLEPGSAYRLADVKTEAAYAALLELARDPAVDASEIGDALQRFDGSRRAVEVGFEVINCVDPCPYPNREAFVRGLFGELYSSDNADQARKRLLKVLGDRHADAEARHLAFVGYRATLSPMEDADFASLRKAFAESTGTLRAAMTMAYPDQLRDDKTQRDELLRLLREDPAEALYEIQRKGFEASDEFLGILDGFLRGEDIELRYLAWGTLHTIAPATWRKRLEEMGRDISPLVAYEALQLASGDSPESLKRAKRVARTHWHPGLQLAANAMTFRPAVPAGAPPDGDDEKPLETIIVSNDAGYANALPRACTNTASSNLPAKLSSRMHNSARIARAGVETDVTAAHLSAALQVPRGWLVGTDEGEFGGRIVYSAKGQPAQDVVRSGAEPAVIFEWRKVIYAVIGGPYTNFGTRSFGSWPVLISLRRQGRGYAARSLAHLPAPLEHVYTDENRLVLVTVGGGAIDFTDPGDPHWLGCSL